MLLQSSVRPPLWCKIDPLKALAKRFICVLIPHDANDVIGLHNIDRVIGLRCREFRIQVACKPERAEVRARARE